MLLGLPIRFSNLYSLIIDLGVTVESGMVTLAIPHLNTGFCKAHAVTWVNFCGSRITALFHLINSPHKCRCPTSFLLSLIKSDNLFFLGIFVMWIAGYPCNVLEASKVVGSHLVFYFWLLLLTCHCSSWWCVHPTLTSSFSITWQYVKRRFPLLLHCYVF